MILKTLALRVVPGLYGRSVLSAKQIVDLHVDKAKEAGKAWYSTNLIVNAKNAVGVDRVLLFGEDIQYLADVLQIRLGKYANDTFVPEDSQLYSPTPFAEEPMRTWILLSNIRQASDEELSALTAPDGTSALEKTKNPGRINRFYCT